MLPAPALLVIQVVVVALTAQVVARVLRRLDQPAVIGQMVAGILLGASVFGLFAGSWQGAVFPHSSLASLKLVGQVGLVAYMFYVGMSTAHGFLRAHVRGAVAVSVSGAAVPLVAAALFATLIVGDHRYFPARVGPFTAVLFFAAAMAVTAFPVMARIIDERRLNGTLVANISLAAGSVSDLIAWSLLAVVTSTLAATFTGALITIGGAAVFVLVALVPVRRLLHWLVASGAARHGPPGWTLVLVGGLLLIAAVVSERIGIHPAFGAFVLGAVVPREGLVGDWPARLAAFTVPVLLPVYFAYSGLNTRIALIGSLELVLVTVAIILVASLSKGVATGVAARLAGIGTREAIAIGALMNARGLVELILLNTGLERGVITPTLFSMMVGMALVTTVATSPVLRLLYPRGVPPAGHEARDPGDGVEVLRDHVLVADANPEPLLQERGEGEEPERVNDPLPEK